MKKITLTILIFTIIIGTAYSISLGIYAQDSTITISNNRLSGVKVDSIISNTIASKFIKPGDIIVNITTGFRIWGYEQPNSSKYKTAKIQTNYLSISEGIQKISGGINTSYLKSTLNSIEEGENFQVMIFRNGRFMEFQIYY